MAAGGIRPASKIVATASSGRKPAGRPIAVVATMSRARHGLEDFELRHGIRLRPTQRFRDFGGKETAAHQRLDGRGREGSEPLALFRAGGDDRADRVDGCEQVSALGGTVLGERTWSRRTDLLRRSVSGVACGSRDGAGADRERRRICRRSGHVNDRCPHGKQSRPPGISVTH
jgi:hypothetical protein